MKVLLIQPPPFYENRHTLIHTFPLSLGYIAKAILKSGHDIEILDIGANGYIGKEVVQRIGNIDYDVVGISAFSTQYAYMKWLTKELRKRSQSKIIIGGALAIHSPQLVLQNTEADICVIGEGEITIQELLEDLDRLENIKGIAYKQGDGVVINPPRELIRNLDSIEFPAWDLFSVNNYIENCYLAGDPRTKVRGVMGMLTGRGCPYSCGYCSKTLSGGRMRSVENITSEIKELLVRYPQIRGIDFWDELFVINRKRLHELCEEIEPLNIKWYCQARVDLVDLDLLKHMKKAGCEVIGYGIESGSQTILDRMNKKSTVEQNQNAVINSIKVGIWPRIHLMYGYPGETKETLRETIEFFKPFPYLKIGTVYSPMLNPTMALPGAELYNHVLREGLIKDEDQYLQHLSSTGYVSGQIPLNLTDFSDEEFYQFKHETEKAIIWGNIKKHPLHFTADYISYLFSWITAGLTRVVPYLRRYGFRQTVIQFTRIIGIRR